MSETNNTEKKAFEIVVEEHEKFAHIMDAKYLSSTELCGIISGLFKEIYADYEGCTFDIPKGTNIPTISLFFNHRDVNLGSLPTACSKDVVDEKTKNATLRSTRSFQHRVNNGDRFFLTDEGKEGLAPFVLDSKNFYQKDGNVNWGKIVTDVADLNTGVPMQYTKVSFIDPAKIMELIFGKKDADDTSWIYGVRIIRSIPTFSVVGAVASENFMLAIERVCEEEVIRLSNQLGLAVTSGLNIIR